ncbi:hypothetical protein HDU85_006033 [Gaertneriomyces sp. JEL0708]|nr:hypothetical protein HDU85_006033 [Gaertneriomyces sp. JEL0708]
MFRSFSADYSTRQPYVLADRQYHSQQDSFEGVDGTPPNAESMPALVWNQIRKRMQKTQLDVSRLSQGLVTFLAPPRYASEHSRSAALALMANNIVVTDKEMMLALELTPCSEDDTLPCGEAAFYIRSWAVAAADLKKVLAYWEENGMGIPEKWTWASTLNDASMRNQVFFVRYVGMCVGSSRTKSTPYRRFEDDLAQRATGAFGHFVRAMNEVAPDVLASGRVYEFRRGRLADTATLEQRSDRERAIIAYFKGDSLLNAQAGGYYASYVPDDAFRTLFNRLQTNFFSLPYEPVDGALVQQLQEWADDITSFAEKYPAETGTSLIGPSEKPSYQDALLEQAIPNMVNGHTVLLCLGKDVTLEDFTSGATFFGGASRAGYLTKDFLARLRVWELGRTSWTVYKFNSDLFPFIDVYPWPRICRLLKCLEFVLRYLQITRHLVTVAFSQHVASIARANFLHDQGLPSENYLDHVGSISVQYFPGLAWVEDESTPDIPPGCATLVIPHLHPGFDKYADQPAPQRIIIDLTWQLTIAVASRAAQLALAGISDRDAIVQTLYQEFAETNVDATSPVHDLYVALQRAKDALRQHWDTRRAAVRVQLDPEIYAESRIQGATTRMERAEFAEGAPNSAERRRQVNRLWKMRIPDTMMHLTANDDESVWKAWALQLKTGKSYMASSIKLAGRLNPGYNPLLELVSGFEPDDDTADWKNDPARIKQIIKDRMAYVRSKCAADNWSSEKQRARVLGSTDPNFGYFARLEGRQVNVERAGRVTLRWLDGTVRRKITITVGTEAVPLSSDDKRYVHFLAGGIGLSDQHGMPLVRPGYANEEGIFRAAHFYRHRDVVVLRRLFDQERQAIAAAAAAPGPAAVPPAAGGVGAPGPAAGGTAAGGTQQNFLPTLGRPLLGNRSQLTSLTPPIQSTDAIWLLNKFLSDKYSEGVQNLLIAHDDDVFGSDDRFVYMLDDFRAFLDEYASHPYYSTWCELVSPVNVDVTASRIMKNIEWLTNGYVRQLRAVQRRVRRPVATGTRISTVARHLVRFTGLKYADVSDY